jgi:osmotically-inducible protein OsmY
MSHRFDEETRWDRERERYRDDDSRDENQGSRASHWGRESRESGWGRESQPYGQREPYNTSARSSYGSGSGYGSGGQGSDDYSRSRWSGRSDFDNRASGGSRYSESQYGQRRPGRDTQGRDYGGGGYRSRSDENRGRGTGSFGEDYREGQYGSGDFGFEQGRRGEPSFGPSSNERYESPRYFGVGSYSEGGSHYTGGYDPRGDRSYSREWSGDPSYSYRGSSASYSGGGYSWDDQQRQRREERPGLLQRLFKRGPKGYQRSDERLREDISERLMMSSSVDSSEVTVSVSSGKVTLEGTVPDRYMKHYIEDLVDACPGVQDIDNRIRVDASSGRWSDESSRNTTTASSTTGTASSTATPSSSTSTSTTKPTRSN